MSKLHYACPQIHLASFSSIFEKKFLEFFCRNWEKLFGYFANFFLGVSETAFFWCTGSRCEKQVFENFSMIFRFWAETFRTFFGNLWAGNPNPSSPSPDAPLEENSFSFKKTRNLFGHWTKIYRASFAESSRCDFQNCIFRVQWYIFKRTLFSKSFSRLGRTACFVSWGTFCRSNFENVRFFYSFRATSEKLPAFSAETFRQVCRTCNLRVKGKFSNLIPPCLEAPFEENYNFFGFLGHWAKFYWHPFPGSFRRDFQNWIFCVQWYIFRKTIFRKVFSSLVRIVSFVSPVPRNTLRRLFLENAVFSTILDNDPNDSGILAQKFQQYCQTFIPLPNGIFEGKYFVWKRNFLQSFSANNIVYSGFATNLAALAQLWIREYTPSLVRCAHSPSHSLSADIASGLYYCSALSSFAIFSTTSYHHPYFWETIFPSCNVTLH